jgi:hypothetical protein
MLRRFIIPAVALCLGLASTAKAGLLPVSVSVTPESGKYRFTYAIVLPTESQLRSGDYFTIYDFAGYQDGSATYSPAPEVPGTENDWAVSISNLGTTPDMTLPSDSASLPNLTWTYNGPTMNAGQTGLGNFWAVSIYGETTDAPFTARTHRTSDGKIDSNITDTTVPVPLPPGLPEPATLVLSALALPLLALRRRIVFGS